jgi:DNA-binding Lrp family transcriptional regulator
LEILREHGPLTLKDISEITKLSPYRLEYYIKGLLAEGKITKTTYVVYKIRK